ncbi:MAG: D-alanyl-D-alanine carboxypeptidase/D-alanyl-D-alanine endopeptidase [Acidobacteriota bacterium]
MEKKFSKQFRRSQHVLLRLPVILAALALLSLPKFIIPPAAATPPQFQIGFQAEPQPLSGPDVDSLSAQAAIPNDSEMIPLESSAAPSLDEVVKPESLDNDLEPPVFNVEPDYSEHTSLARKIDAILSRSSVQRGFWGVEVYSISDGALLYSHNGDKHFSPASNVKVFTTAAALDRLGADFRFETPVAYEGTLSADGELSGDLVLFGRGDPDLAGKLEADKEMFENLDLIAQKIKEAGIREVSGDIIGDDSYFWFSPYGKGWKLTDLNHYYGAPVSALSFMDNTAQIRAFAAGKIGHPARLYSWPTSFMDIENKTRTVRSKSKNTLHFARPMGSKLQVGGQVPHGTKNWTLTIPVDNPALYTASIFRDRLEKAGVEIKGEAKSRHYGGTSNVQSTTVYVHRSLPLIEIISYINKKSQNLYAEILLRTLGAELKDEGTDFGGIQVVYEFLQEAGIGQEMVELHDGSGLSRLNLITPRAETLLLAELSNRHYFPLFWESLSISSRDGTLKNRMKKTSAAQRVHGKTGTLDEVSTLGGYVETQSGRTLAFAILLNNYNFSYWTARKTFDEICGVLAKY